MYSLSKTRHHTQIHDKNEGKQKQMNLCISDRVFNYLQMAEKKFKNFNIKNNLEQIPDDFWSIVYEKYKDLRVDLYFGNHNPRLSAATLIYYCAQKNNLSLTQKDIAIIFEISNHSIRYNHKRMIKDLD